MNYLSGRKQYAEAYGVASETKHIRCGVLQGSLIGTRLFSVYDLASAVSVWEMYLFADNTNFFYSDTKIERLIDMKEVCLYNGV